MTSRTRILTSLLILVVGLTVAATALASPDGDDDTTYNAGSAFGTRYSPLANDQGGRLSGARPVTDEDAADGSSVTANLMEVRSKGTFYYLRLTRFGPNGLPAGFDTVEFNLPGGPSYTELLDLRVLPDRSFVVLIRGYEGESVDQTLFLRHFDVNGAEVPSSDRAYRLPNACLLNRGEGEFGIYGYIKAARVTAGGGAFGLWDCDFTERDVSTESRATRGIAVTAFDTRVARYPAGQASGTSSDSVGLDGVDYGVDLELGPNGDPYALTGTYPGSGVRLAEGPGQSNVFHVGATSLTVVNSSFGIPGLPVDFAVDSQARPVVWTESFTEPQRGGTESWTIWRLLPDLSNVDTSWNGSGRTVVADPRLSDAQTPNGFDHNRIYFLTVRPGDKVLASGRQFSSFDREAGNYNNGIIVGLTSGGQVDAGFATNGFKPFEFSAEGRFDRIGEPTLQSDGKVLIPHTTDRDTDVPARIADPPSPSIFVGVTRLVSPVQPSSPGAQPARPAAPVAPSSTPAICGRRAISLVRADVQGRRVKLTGLVGAALYGKTVTIQTDPKGSRASKYTKTTTVRASSTGSFTAFVAKPKAADFISIRYRAVSGRAVSPSLKLPQRLTSRSVKSAQGTITVKGRVKKSVLGKRNKVLIRRLVCGRYRTVGTAKPDADGNYTVTFRATAIRGVSFYRAESKVLRKEGSKVYVIQYARAIAIRTTSQTG